MENETIETTGTDVQKTNIFTKSVAWVKDHKKSLIKGTIVAAVVAAGVLLLKKSSTSDTEADDLEDTNSDFDPDFNSETSETNN